MKLRDIKIMTVVIAYVLGMGVDVRACLTTFINDKGGRVIIYNKNDKTLVPISKHEKRRFGNQNQHAHFAIYVQQPKKQLFTRMYVCKQNGCGKNGNVQLKLSDIEHGTEATQSFTITKSRPHSSMAQEAIDGTRK